MKHIVALIVKFIIVSVILEIILLATTNLSFTNILTVSLTVTLLAYIIGDLIILPNSNNTVSTVADAGLALVTVWMFNWLIPGAAITLFDAALAAVGIAVGEWIFHKFMAGSILPSQR